MRSIVPFIKHEKIFLAFIIFRATFLKTGCHYLKHHTQPLASQHIEIKYGSLVFK